MNEYNLIYYRIEDNRKFFGRRCSPVDYRLIDSVTGENIAMSQHKLTMYYNKDPQNKLFRMPKETQATKRKVKINSKAFQEYLYGTKC